MPLPSFNATDRWRRNYLKAANLQLSTLNLQTCNLQLKGELQRELHLARIAHALPQEAVEVEQARCCQRVHVVGVVESVEHLHGWNQRVALAQLDRTHQAPIEREVLIVLSQSVAVCRGPNVRRNRLSAVSLDPEDAVHSPEHIHERIEIELVPFIAIRQGVVQLEVVDVERPVGEWIALIRIIVLVLGKHVVPFELKTVAQPLAHPNGKAVVKGLAERARHKNAAQLWKESLSRPVKEASQMNALRM